MAQCLESKVSVWVSAPSDISLLKLHALCRDIEQVVAEAGNSGLNYLKAVRASSHFYFLVL